MNGSVVFHQYGHLALRIPDRDQIGKARRMDILVRRDVVEVVGKKLSFQGGPVDENSHEEKQPPQKQGLPSGRERGTGRDLTALGSGRLFLVDVFLQDPLLPWVLSGGGYQSL